MIGVRARGVRRSGAWLALLTALACARSTPWPEGFREIAFPGAAGRPQRAMLRAASVPGRPLVVSLHTWDGDYRQLEPALLNGVVERDYAFVQPDFGGSNQGPDGCCSDAAILDIDAAIDFAVAHTQADPGQVHVVGVSGGGYAALCSYLRGARPLRSVQAWAPISDLVRWHAESRARGLYYADDIEACSGAPGALDVAEASRRSPLSMPIARERIEATRLRLYAGIHDGHRGSVPISHALRFYDRIAETTGAGSEERFDAPEIERLAADPALARAAGGAPRAQLETRDVVLEREHGLARVTLFEGGHELLPGAALAQIERDAR